MILSHQDAALFFKLHPKLICFVNERLKIVAGVAGPEHLRTLPPQDRLKVRDALVDHLDLIEAFADENPAGLPEEELAIVRSWRHLVTGSFYVMRELKKHALFLSSGDNPIAYGVLALTQPFKELIGFHLPYLTRAVLLPFNGVIVYDGLMSGHNVSFGGGAKRILNESLKAAKEKHGVVTSLPMSDKPMRPEEPKAKPRPQTDPKEQTAEVLRSIVSLTDQFCREHLTDECAALCQKLAEKLARKRPSPLLKSSPNAWASGIVRTIAWVNFLSDKTQTPYVRQNDIDAAFGISASTGAARLADIRRMLRIHQFDHKWILPSQMEDSPMIWMVEVDGFVMDVRRAAREIQEIAFAKGLIPYVPADRANGAEPRG